MSSDYFHCHYCNKGEIHNVDYPKHENGKCIEKRSKVVIVGAGEIGTTVAREMMKDPSMMGKTVLIVDHGASLEGATMKEPVFPYKAPPKLENITMYDHPRTDGKTERKKRRKQKGISFTQKLYGRR